MISKCKHCDGVDREQLDILVRGVLALLADPERSSGDHVHVAESKIDTDYRYADEGKIDMARRLVGEGMGVCQAARIAGVSRATLYRRGITARKNPYYEAILG